jgi:hypothetical protein
MHRLIPRSQLAIYDGGHLDLVSEPRRMAATAEAFLTAGTGSATGSADDAPATHRGRRRARA